MNNLMILKIIFVFRSEEEKQKQLELKEMIFLRDLHFGFLPDDCEDEFTDCFERIGKVKIKFGGMVG